MILTTIPNAHLCSDPRINDTPSGGHVANIRVAGNYRVKSDDGEWSSAALFFDVALWHGADAVSQHFQKGSPIIVWGEQRERHWTDRDGNERTNLELANASWDFPHKTDGAGENSQPRQAAQQKAPAPAAAPLSAGDFADSDIPF